MSVYGSTGGWVAVGLLVVIALVAIFGNILLICLVLSKPDMRENINCFVLSLAVVDLLTAMLVMPLQSYHSAVQVSTESTLCVCINIFAVMSAMASVLSLSCVTVDRYLVISRPLRYVTLVTTRRVFTVTGLVWLYSIATSIFILIPWKTVVVTQASTDNSTGICLVSFLVGMPYGYFLMCNFFIPVPVMFVMYAHIFIIARRHAKAIHEARRISNVDPNLPYPSLMRQNIRIAAVLFFITAYFFISWTCTILLLALTRYIPKYVFELSVSYKIVFYTNAATNPFLYIFHHRKLRTYLMSALRRKLSRGTVAPSPVASTVTLVAPAPRGNSLFAMT